jgi:hypothetical protein
MAETAYAIPVYRDWPERPYDVIGSVRFQDPRVYWDDGIIRMAADEGKKNGGDALVLRFGSVAPGSWLDQWTARPAGYGQEITALVIKWTPQSVLQAREADDERFWQSFREKHPKTSSNDQLLKIAVGIANETGVGRNSPQFADKIDGILSEIAQQPKGSLAGKWLLKATVQTKTITSSDAQSFFGVAVLASTGNRITFVSTEGNAEVNFSGTVDGGQVSGTLGFGGSASSVSVKCEGVALDDKISFAFQKLTDGGTVQGTLTLQR